MIGYRARLQRDLERWQSAGWVSSEGLTQIRSDLESRRSGVGLSSALAILAAVLLGFAAMSFVAANWEHMSKLSRLSLLATALLASYAAAAVLFAREMPGLGHAAVLTGVAIFGAAIMLIAQMYHMDGHPPDAVWLWGLGALLAGFALRSNPAIAAAVVLFFVWTMYEMQMTRGVHGMYLPMWALTAAAVAMTRWRVGLQLLAMALSAWIIFSGYQVSHWRVSTGHAVVTAVGLGLVALSVIAGDIIDRWRRISGAMLGYGMVIAFAGAFGLQFIAEPEETRLLVLGGLTLAVLVGALIWAWRTDNRPALWIAYAAFSIEIFSLYIKKLGTLMSTSAFFLVAGLIVAVLAAAALKLHKAPREGQSEGVVS